MFFVLLKKNFNFTVKYFSTKVNDNLVKNVIETVRIKRIITTADVKKFASLSGDTNPVHSGDKAIVHGALLNSLVSAVIGTKLPGPGSIVISQTLNFPNKCYVGENVTVIVNVLERRKIIKVEYFCEVESEKKIVMYGNAKLMFNKI